MTFDDMRALSARLFAASDCLMSNGFHNQAIARAYYGVFVAVDFWTRRQQSWPWPQNDDGSPMSRLPHSQVHNYAEHAFASAGLVTTRSLQPPNARDATVQLKAQRILADYRTYIEQPELTTRRLISNARELCSVIMIEADKVKTNAPFPAA